MGKTIKNVEVVDAEKRRIPSKHYVYVIVVRWSDGSCFKIFRRYSRFFDLQTVLLDSFPIEGGSLDPNKRVMPFLPGKIFFGRSHIKEVAMRRLGEINDYCQSLVALPAKIAQCDHVLEFFEVELDDLDPPVPEPNESKKGPPKEKKAEKISKPKRLECYVAVAQYIVQAPGELALVPGMRVEVLEKNDIGWWFVNSEDEQGWVPSTYLEPEDGTYMSQVPRALPGEEEMFVCIEDFQASSEDEVSLEKGVAVSVIQKNMDGWWLVRYQGKEAFAPGTYLKKATNASRVSMMEKSRLSGVEIVSSLQDVSTLLNSDKKDKSKAEASANERTVPSALIKTRSMERGGSLKPPPRQNSVKKIDIPILAQKSPIYVTIADFTDSVGDGVSFTEGQKVLVREKTSTGWWLIKLGQEEGWVPASYLESYTGKMDTPSVYELANSGTLTYDGANTYEENDDSGSDSGEWYTVPDDVPTSPPPQLSTQQGGQTKRPLPEVPVENDDYEPFVEVKTGMGCPPPPPPPPPKGDCQEDTHRSKFPLPSKPQSNSNIDKRSLPATPKSDNDKGNENQKNIPTPSAAAGPSDLASVLKAKFESRAGATENVQSTPGDGKNGAALKSSGPSLPTKPSGGPSLPTKPSEMKKLQKETAIKPAVPSAPNKSGPNMLKPAKPGPPPKSKSPNIFQNTEQKPPLPGVFPKFPLKPVSSGESSSGSKTEAKTEKNDVKNMAAMLSKSLGPKPAAAEPAPPGKLPVAPKPQVANKPKPSLPSKPSLAAKPKPAIQPKTSSQGVSNLASALNNKLNFNSSVSANNNNDEKNTSVNKNSIAAPSKTKTKTMVALCDFIGEMEGELSFNEGDTVEILEDNGDWVFIELWDEQGWAPASFFQEM